MFTAKVMLLGDMGVGKTSILHRLVHDRFEGEYKTTLGVEILGYDVPADLLDGEEPARLVLWDTDGEFGSHIFDTVYVAGASAAVIVSDVTRPPTLAHMAELARGFEARFPGRPYAALVNKMDLAGDSTDTGRFSELGLPVVKLVSAKSGSGITDAFVELVHTIRRRQL